MSLAPGRRLGPYEIQSAIGAGGMGEVFRAHDTKLGRDVALKILPASLAGDPDRLMRFDREAKTLAALNHPNIAAIHGLEESGAIRALVMELVEGEDLAARIRGGPMSIGEALAVARQIADALDAAHDAGIVHRDLKPANIMVREDGTVKVLDFGLAKALGPSEGDGFGRRQAEAEASALPTITSPADTLAGTILGTAAYMSPEQARGKPVDRRADIWSFGCVLFEMLTGRRAFPGTTVSDTIAAILEREPEWDALPASTPASLKTLLRRCLTKDKAKRLRDIGDAKVELIGEDSGAVTASPPARRAPWSGVAAALILALAIGAATRFIGQPGRPAPLVVRFSIPLGPGQNFPTGLEAYVLGLSPDAGRIAFALNDGIHVRSVDQLDDRLIPGTEGDQAPSFSADGESLVFSSGGGLKTTKVSGGTLTNIPGTDHGGAPSWGAAGIAFEVNRGRGGIAFVAPESTPQPVTTLGTADRAHTRPQILPDQDKILFTIQGDIPHAAVASRKTRTWQVLDALGQADAAHFVQDGFVVFSRGDQLLAAPFDVGSLRVTAAPFVVVPSAQPASLAVSRSGSLAYQSPSANTLVWVDRQGKELSVVGGLGSANHPRLSRDGTQLYALGNLDLWIVDLVRGGRTRLTTDGRNRDGLWHPNGKDVTFLSASTGQGDIYTIPADGSGQPTLLLGRPYEQQPFSWTPDGRILAFTELNPTTGADLGTISDDGVVKPLLTTKANEMVPEFSPDGRWLAYVSDESGRREVYVRPYPAFDQKWTISADGGAEPVWRRDGKELFYRDGDTVMAVAVNTTAGFTASAPQTLFRGDYVPANTTTGDPHFEAAPDGQRFIMVKASKTASQIVVVLNWAEELKARLATR